MNSGIDVINTRMEAINAIHDVYEELFGEMLTGDGDY